MQFSFERVRDNMATRAVFVLVCLGALVQVRTLRWIGLKVPELDANQTEAEFECRFHVEDNEYFEIANWYKDGKLLLSCLPTGTHQRHSVRGIHIRYRGKDPMGVCDFKLEDITKKALGVYKCEAAVYYPQNVGVWGFAKLGRKTGATPDDTSSNEVSEATTEFVEKDVTDGDSTEINH